MKDFPNFLTPENSKNFKTMLYERNLAYLRRDIYEHILKNNKETPFDVDSFNNSKVNDKDIIKQMIDKIAEELTTLNWSTLLAYGNSSLYIYPKNEEPPVSCGEELCEL